MSAIDSTTILILKSLTPIRQHQSGYCRDRCYHQREWINHVECNSDHGDGNKGQGIYCLGSPLADYPGTMA